MLNVAAQWRAAQNIPLQTEGATARPLKQSGSALLRQLSSVAKIVEFDQQPAGSRLGRDLPTDLHLT